MAGSLGICILDGIVMALTLQGLICLGTVIAVLFGSAGRRDLPFFWAFLGVVVVTCSENFFRG
jgi:hypothetical protein